MNTLTDAATADELKKPARFSQYLPIIEWLKNYQLISFSDDLFAGIITAILLVPQGVAYAILAGLPPETGLYASILPPVLYALFGTSKTLSVGPVSIAAIMIASALNAPEIKLLGDVVSSSLILALESGLLMLLMAVFRMGGLVNFISHPVLAGFTSGAAILIIANQLPQLAGLKPPDCAIDMACYSHYVQTINTSSLFISITSLAILVFFGKPIASLLKKIGITSTLSTAISKCGALLCVVLTTLAVSYFNLSQQHVAIVGSIPAGFPQLKLEFFNLNHYKLLLPYAAFIALIAYVESVAIAKVTANLRGEKINPNQELIALGTANLASALSGGMPVAGGFSRTMVNFSAGARSQMAMLIAAFILSVAVIFFSDDFSNIPKPALAAIIVVAIFRLVRIKHIIHTWHYDKGDGIAEIMTLLGVLVLGIEQGITLGIILTIASHLKKASHPHIAVVGRVPQTEHFRNIKRHSVETWHHLLLVRIDDSLTFANVSYIQDYLADELIRQPNTKHVVLIFTSVSDIDSTALEALEMINQGLQATNKTLNIAEAKGPVQDKLEKTDFIKQLKPGRLFFRTEDAVRYLG